MADEVQTVPPSEEEALAKARDYIRRRLAESPGEGPIPGPQLIGPESLRQRGERLYRKAHEAPGVPLETDEELSGVQRALTSLRLGEEREFQYLQKQYPGKVRRTTDGRIFIRVTDEAGKSKDIPADSPDLTAQDLIDMVGAVPAIATSIAAERIPVLRGLKGILGAVRSGTLMAGGAVSERAAQKAATETLDVGQVNWPKIGKEAGAEAVVDASLGTGAMLLRNFWRWMKNPLTHSQTEAQFNALGAQKYLAEKFGETVPLSVGEKTGSAAASITESFYERQIGSFPVFRQFKQAQNESIRRLQLRLMGGPAMSDEAIGGQMIQALELQSQPMKQAVETARQQLGAKSAAALEDFIGTSIGARRPASYTELGSRVREKLFDLRETARAEKNRLYEVANQLGADQPIIDTTPLAKKATAMLSRLSLPEAAGGEAAPEFTPPDILGRLNRLIDLRGKKMSPAQLQEWRHDVYESIPRGEGVPGRGEKYLKEIGQMFTETIEQGVDRLPSGRLKNALQQANQFYKTDMVPFSEVGTSEVFRLPTEGAGYVGNSQLVTRLFNNPDLYNQLKSKLVGQPGRFHATVEGEWDEVRQSLLDHVVDKSRHTDGTIDADSLINHVRSWQTDKATKEIAQDVLGPNVSKLFNDAKYLGIAQGGKVPEEELHALMASPNPRAADLRRLVEAEKVRDSAFKNRLLKAAAEGKLDEVSIAPGEFAARFLEKAEPAEVRDILGRLGNRPALLDDIRAKYIEHILNKAASSPESLAAARILKGQPGVDVLAKPILKQLADKETNDKFTTVLGPELRHDFDEFVKLLNAIDAKHELAPQSGGFARGQMVAAMVSRGPLATMYQSGKHWLTAKLLTAPVARQWLSHQPGDTGRWTLLMANPEFLQEVVREFGEGTKADQFIDALKDSMGTFVNQSPMSATPEEQRAREFIRQRLKTQ